MNARRSPAAGAAAEKRARSFLERRKLNVVAANYRTRCGEIDLVMRDGDALVFIEVRHRRGKFFGCAAESVDSVKQGKIIRAAQEFLQTHRHDGPLRFDVVAFDGPAPSAPTWIKNAFEAEW